MVSFRDTITLSLTKLRVRRIRLAVTLVVSGALFTTLVFGSLFIRGTMGSLMSFAQEGLLDHFFAQVMGDDHYGISQDKTYVARARDLQKIRTQQQVAAAKQLGITFDPKTEPQATTEDAGTAGHQTYLSLDQPAARQAITEISQNTPDKAAALAKPYHPLAIYHGQTLSQTPTPGEYTLTPIIKGQEQAAAPPGTSGFGPRDSITSFQNSLNAFDNGLIRPFLLDGTTLDTKPGDPIPILTPIDAAGKLINLPALPQKASPAAKVARLGELRTAAKNLVFEVCYRNKTELDIRSTAKQQLDDAAAHKSDSAYQKPALQYAALTNDCTPTAIASDTRSPEDKTLAAKRLIFDQQFGAEKPIATKIKFRIVGILPQLGAEFSTNGIEGAITGLFSSTLGDGWFMSREAAAQDPILGNIINDPVAKAVTGIQSYIEFPNRDAEKRFILEKSCQPDPSAQPDCTGGKLYIYAFGNPLAVLYDAGPGFFKALKWVIGIIALLSAIVMMGTLGKIIADSRKETSVFRAVGAKRHHIAQIYLLYTLILATLSFAVALAAGIAIALVLESQHGASLSVQAVLAFNSHDLHKAFHLIGFNWLDISLIYIFVLVISLVSASIPLYANLSRSPIKDMREE